MFYSRFLSSFCKNCRLCFLLFGIKMRPKEGDEECPVSSLQCFVHRRRISEIATHNFSTKLGKGFCFIGIDIPGYYTSNKLRIGVCTNSTNQPPALCSGSAKHCNNFSCCHKTKKMFNDYMNNKIGYNCLGQLIELKQI